MAGLDVPGEEDDDKRRRNLMSFAVAACLSAFFGLDLAQIAAKVLPAGAVIPAWKAYVAGMLINVYLLQRYLLRDSGIDSGPPIVWLDGRTLVEAVVNVQANQLTWAVISRIKKKGKRSFMALGASLFETDPYAELLGDLKARGAPIDGNGDVTGLRFSTLSEMAGEAAPVSNVTVMPAWALPVRVKLTTAFLDASDKEWVAEAVVGVKRQSPAATWFKVCALVRVLTFSRLAVDVLLPYYLSAAAAVVMTYRYLNA